MLTNPDFRPQDYFNFKKDYYKDIAVNNVLYMDEKTGLVVIEFHPKPSDSSNIVVFVSSNGSILGKYDYQKWEMIDGIWYYSGSFGHPQKRRLIYGNLERNLEM